MYFSKIQKEFDVTRKLIGERYLPPASFYGYHEMENIFVEGRFHDIYLIAFANHTKSYKPYYAYLKRKTGGLFDYWIHGRGRYVWFSWNGDQIICMDIKQLLCRMLEIGRKALAQGFSSAPTLMYLVYEPSKELLDFIPNKQITEFIQRIPEVEMNETLLVDFRLLYAATVRFLAENTPFADSLSKSQIETISSAFNFVVCNQHNYSKYFK